MRQVPGMQARRIVLPSIDGTTFDTATLLGRRYMVAFHRFAGCPFCNMRIHELVSRFGEFGDAFQIVAVFDSPINDLLRYGPRHKAPFPIVADPENRYYREYGVERSLVGMFKGIAVRLPTLVKSVARGFIPTTITGNVATMPANFLIDETGIIQEAHYGRDDGDHLPIDRVRDFSLGVNTGS